ncbi:fungal specific transcription factor domain-containing protein [Aspergillus homomorphus CBS 101889]|uniref:Xylanolytic transcriptional activator regulatory domain-containing protein n=1 Tax=Aspergillus homomorphus (strain CBS 101889) TaxID=1450537 RepID=A0A395HL59_ASPHC|nr:hypothetical protein BO97DRAFT_473504 [Aspergillus homomorphus CBS 101889]RAL07608.1 hypothetical protein BO97DRAFT_473504 [Aspergillus homomorphus CBS 101889]
MSDRLVVHPSHPQCECDSLRARLTAAERRCSELLQQNQELQVKLLESIQPPSPTLSGAWELWGDDAGGHVPIVHEVEIGQETYINLSEAFFDRRWPYLPIVCAIAATERSYRPSSDETHRQLFKNAVRDLQLIMEAGDLEYMQCLLLLSMYGHNEPQSGNIWYSTGMALHLVIGLDLHRKESLIGQDMLQAELPAIEEPIIPQVTDMSPFNHIIALRQINAGVYKHFHPKGGVGANPFELDQLRNRYSFDLNQCLITAPRYVHTLSTVQSAEWFHIAFHHAMLSLYRPSRAVPIPLPHDLRTCLESAIGLINSYSALYARNRIKYTFVAIHSLLMAAVTMLYSLRASASLRQELTKPVVQTNIQTFLTLFRGICNGREVGEKCSQIVERLGDSILTLYDDADRTDADVDTEFQSWFGLQTHTYVQTDEAPSTHTISPHFPDVRIDLPWADLFAEGINMGATDVWSIFPRRVG